jgi:hypothetical protein
MPNPIVHAFPVRRVNFFTSVEWVGPDNQLELKVQYLSETGAVRQVVFATRHTADGVKGEICLPNSNNLQDLGPRYEDILTAHTRMSCLVARSGIPGSTEFLEAILNGPSANINTALGVVKVTDVVAIDDQTVAISYRQGTGPILTINQEYRNLNDYTFAPETQLFVIPGSVKKSFSTYVHDYPSVILSQERRDDIAAHVLAMEPWI